MKKQYKIAFSGPSGLGKSTLCRYLDEITPLSWKSTSAGDIMTSIDKTLLKQKYGYVGEGHRKVINMSSTNPAFGMEFQKIILNRRADQIFQNTNFIIDRSPIDNVAYMLMQISHNASEEFIKNFIQTAQLSYLELTHVIQIRYSQDIPFIEDNHSRIPNRYFQQYVSDVFAGVYARYFANLVGPRVLTLDFWDLELRKKTLRDFIFDPQLEIDYDQVS